MTVHSGRHFLQIPGPTNVPDRVLRAISRPTIDHRGPEFSTLACELLEEIPSVFGTEGRVVIYPASGTGAWEAALVNTLSPGDRVVSFETGHFSTLWTHLATAFGLEVTVLPGDWRRGAQPEALAAELADDSEHSIKAVMLVHNETSTGVTSRVGDVRQVIDEARHPSLLLVDAISSLGSIDFRHDEWGVDVTVACSQKGLMLPPGLGFNAVSEKALMASAGARLPRFYWEWGPILAANLQGFWPYTPPTNLLYGLREALRMLREERLPAVFARHMRHAEATRRAVRAWGLELVCVDPREYSPVLTAVLLPEGHDADAARRVILEEFDVSLGTGLARFASRVFRIGHLGHFNDAALMGTLGSIEIGLIRAGIPIKAGGLDAALQHLRGDPAGDST
jgi:alanine-glyoxylate transaminase / serine-glyoxylate transaminase / serine-pyruvate transaminase